MKTLKRREFLKVAGLAGAGLVAAACDGLKLPATATPAGPAASPSPSAVPPTPIEVTAAVRPSPAVSPLAKKPVRLVQWDAWDAAGAWFDEEIQRFQQTYPWIVIERIRQDDMPAALQQARQARALPDLYFGGPAPISQFESKQWLCTPLSDFADFADFKAIFPSPDLDFAPGSNVIDGKAYTAPREMRTGYRQVTFVNSNLFEHYGIAELPTNDVEFVEACRKIAQDSSGAAYGYGNGFATGWMNALFEWLGARSLKVGGRDWRESGSQYVRNPAYQNLLEMLSALAADGLILPESYTAGASELRALFADNRVAVIHGEMDAVAGWKQSHPEFSNYTLLPPLLLNGPQQFACYAPPGITGTPLYISNQSKHPEEAWLWFKWLHLPECGQRWVKAGHGLSIFLENQRPELFADPIWQDYIRLNNELTRVEPFPAARKLACNRVNVQPVETSYASLVQMVYDYWLPGDDIPPALEKLAADSDTNWHAALAEAQRDGVEVTQDDFIFADWNPLEDYFPQQAKTE
ncbi:MAG: ABC transporter substrate-binding protein [Chloroflexota bacterium]